MDTESIAFRDLPRPLENKVILALENWLLQKAIVPYVEYSPCFLQNIRSMVSYRKSIIRRGFLYTSKISPLLDRLIWYPEHNEFRYTVSQDWNEEFLKILSIFTCVEQRTRYNY